MRSSTSGCRLLWLAEWLVRWAGVSGSPQSAETVPLLHMVQLLLQLLHPIPLQHVRATATTRPTATAWPSCRCYSHRGLDDPARVLGSID